MAIQEARLCMLTVKQAATQLARREISAVELTESVLERIEETQPRLEAYASVTADEALAAARAADAREPSDPLHAIPVALKDLFDVAGVPTKAGSRSREAFVPVEDAAATARLRSAGAIITGKTVTHEFAFGVTSPPTRCPWNTGCIPGGSSGGSGAAVAADACLAALGTDTGCSIRVPAAINGVVGLKPTYGRVSRRGVVPLSWSCDHAGPIAKTVEDCALVLNAIAGHDPRDPTSAREGAPDFTAELERGLDGLRIGIPRKYFFDGIQPGVEAAVRDATAVLEREGAELVEVAIPHVELSLPVVLVASLVEGATIHRRSLRAKTDLYGDEVRFLLEAGQLLFGTHYLDAQRVRTLIKRSLREVFEREGLSLLATPTAPLTALPIGQETFAFGDEPPQPVINHYARYCCPFNLSGQPALSVPCGFDEQRLPVGLQLVGRPFDEVTVLRAGNAYEAATSWHREHPPL
jgi:aspartyl-tRNA(Asn)/glutamyl-tRNA(Gln) amidotransferase subunit A